MTPGSSGKICVDQQERVAVVTPCGEMDLHDLTEVVDTLTGVLSDTSTDATLLDLSQLTFADSVFLNQILVTYSGHAAKRRPLVLCGPLHDSVQRLLEITGTDSVLPLAAGRQDALERLRTSEAP
ncbi:STAS domain-containing protein [Streptomyces kunmingensis]|uniref:STAS domain-containing protein n=1 Tax=Streptomyces kunmingensis TaxID=68225 RepID=UPI002D790A7B|nr:STAS domain-containing protein [Streptomyces kunmingensis]